uniref:Uncharacterized protein MANES_09G096700 n=1 Tax=Rhizophora mucronata TaxID=61149 RepID=A0A2P2LN16_RHIMU
MEQPPQVQSILRAILACSLQLPGELLHNDRFNFR